MRKCFTWASVVFLTLICGCSGMQASNTDELMKQPLGTGGLSLGMTRSQVVEKYGQPDTKSTIESIGWNDPRQEWFYRARYNLLPVNVGYLSEDLYLYFDGDNLTNISKRPLGFDQEDSGEDAESR